MLNDRVPTQKWTIAFDGNSQRRKLFKVFIGQDGSYYVTVPYHPAHRALIFRQDISYAQGNVSLKLDDANELAVLEDDEARLKLVHHPDGFIQFSGKGVTSGRNALTGEPNGVGTFSWPLFRPVAGPSFGVTIIGVEDFMSASTAEQNSVVFDADDLDPGPDDNALTIEGYYFAPPMRRFLSRDWRGRRVVRVAHPSRGVLEMPVCLSRNSNDLPGFIALEMTTKLVEFPEKSGYMLSSATGRARRDASGGLIAEGLFAIFPAALAGVPGRARSLDYRPDEPPYVLPPSG